jgi:predicted RNase H-like nuclease (RuvC/YqgF family)
MMMGYGIWMALSSIFSGLMCGGVVWIFNIRAKKKEANAQAANAEAIADSSFIKNLRESISVYKEMADDVKKELEEYRLRVGEMDKQLESMRKEITKLTSRVTKLSATINKIPKMLNSITHENLEVMVQKIKDEINREQNAQQD